MSRTARIDVVVRAAQDAGIDTSYQVLGVTGVWVDDGDSVVNGVDTFICSGIGTSSIYVA
ncbi:MAG: hypothetical protein ACXWZF_04430 [Actinomycetota bacterium]